MKSLKVALILHLIPFGGFIYLGNISRAIKYLILFLCVGLISPLFGGLIYLYSFYSVYRLCEEINEKARPLTAKEKKDAKELKITLEREDIIDKYI